MAQQTTNYNLNKIDKTDKITDSLDYLNQNADSIDFELKRLNIQVLDNLQEAKNYADEEIAKFDFIKIVDTLPDSGLPNRIYFVPKTDTQTQDLFDEYAWINDTWEWITTKQIEVDLTECVKKSEMPTIATQNVVTNFWSGTQEEYDALTEISDTTLYLITE